MAAILDLKVKSRSNHENDIRYEFLDPKYLRNHILHRIVGQINENPIFKMVEGGHLEFGALTELAR